jgi:predicted Rossmann-fold nucleotide-binding protein
VIFAPGSAGTIQEIFQDATQNHYETFDGPSPMVFFGKGYWTLEKPVYPLLAQLAKGLPYSRWIAISDDPEEVVRWIESYAEEVFL